MCVLCVKSGRGHPVEDEKHVLVDCPDFQDLRDEYTDKLPFASRDMHTIMSCNNQKDLAAFVSSLRDLFEQKHDACVEAIACEKCASQADAARMLICDGKCCRAYHAYCLEPALTALPPPHVPWFCDACSQARH